MSDKKGIKESKELLDALAILGKAGKGMAADGKVGMDDLKYLVDVAKDFDTILEGFKDLGELDDELKDLSEAEAMELLAHLFAKLKELK